VVAGLLAVATLVCWSPCCSKPAPKSTYQASHADTAAPVFSAYTRLPSDQANDWGQVRGHVTQKFWVEEWSEKDAYLELDLNKWSELGPQRGQDLVLLLNRCALALTERGSRISEELKLAYKKCYKDVATRLSGFGYQSYHRRYVFAYRAAALGIMMSSKQVAESPLVSDLIRSEFEWLQEEGMGKKDRLNTVANKPASQLDGSQLLAMYYAANEWARALRKNGAGHGRPELKALETSQVVEWWRRVLTLQEGHLVKASSIVSDSNSMGGDYVVQYQDGTTHPSLHPGSAMRSIWLCQLCLIDAQGSQRSESESAFRDAQERLEMAMQSLTHEVSDSDINDAKREMQFRPSRSWNEYVLAYWIRSARLAYFLLQDMHEEATQRRVASSAGMAKLIALGRRLGFAADVQVGFQKTEDGSIRPDSDRHFMGDGQFYIDRWLRGVSKPGDNTRQAEAGQAARGTPWTVSHTPLYFCIIEAERNTIGRLKDGM
jgi:hypothetical protein